MKVPIIEQILNNNNQCGIEDLLWECGKYLQAQLFTKLYGMNINDLYSRKGKVSKIIVFEEMFRIFNDI